MKSIIAFAATFALLVGCSATRAASADKADGDVTIMSDVTLASADAPVPIAKVGDTEIAIRPLPKKKEKDPPSMALFVGDAIRSKTVLYPGKTYHVAVTKVGNDRLRLFVNGYPDDQPVPGTLSGAITKIAPHIAVEPKSLLADQILETFRKALALTKPIVTVGHRGVNKYAPENTRISYVQMVETGAPIAEMDLALTKDGQIVLMHDKTVDRTTGGKGKVAVNSLTLEQIKKLDAGAWKNAKYKGEPVPTLDEIAEVCKGKAIMMLDLKAEGQGEALAAWLERQKMPHDQVILAPWTDDEGVALRKHIAADVPMIRLTSPVPTDTLDSSYFDRMKQIGFSGFSVNYQNLTQAFVDAAHKNGMKVYAWTINESPDVALAALMGVDGVITDDAANTMKLLAELTQK
jgi:glycerophosphoryl diester phosphodiesterase